MLQSFNLSRRRLIPAGMAAALAPGLSQPSDADPADHGACTSNIPEMALPKRPSPETHSLDYSHSEIDLAFRNHGMLTEMVREPITPLGSHYLLTHFDVPRLSGDNYTIAIGGRVNTPIQVSLRDLQARRAMSQVVTMECAGLGRAALRPRPVYVPWNEMALGTYEWDDPGDPVREKRVGSLMAPPGLPDLLSRTRYLAPGAQVLEGVAWSGQRPVSKVEVSVDGGASWQPARVSTVSDDPFAWVQWRPQWQAAPGGHVLMSRATDSQGAQPLDPNTVWNYQGNGINAVKPINVVVEKAVGAASLQVPCTPRLVLPGEKVPPQPSAINQAV